MIDEATRINNETKKTEKRKLSLKLKRDFETKQEGGSAERKSPNCDLSN
jgi:hypothetical protein